MNQGLLSMGNQIDREIGARIQRRREALGLGRDAVSAALGIDGETIRAFEEGEKRLSARQLQKLCAVLKAPPSSFLVADEDAGPDGLSADRAALLNDAHRLYRSFFQIESAELRSILADLAESFARGGRSSALIEAARQLQPTDNAETNIARLNAFRTGPWSH